MAIKNFTSMMVTNKEFFKQACRWKDSSSIQTAAEWWSAFQEVIIREIFYNGVCRVPGLGTFSVNTQESYFQKQRGPGGKIMTYLVPERMTPVFVPEDDFVNDINMQGVTKKYRQRLRDGALNERDFARQVRADSLEAGVCIEEMMEQRKKEAQKELRKLLAKKRKLKLEANENAVKELWPANPVIQMDMDGNKIASFPSMSVAERETGIKKIYISNCCNPARRQKTAGGYKWKYAEEKENVKDDVSKQSEASDTES